MILDNINKVDLTKKFVGKKFILSVTKTEEDNIENEEVVLNKINQVQDKVQQLEH